MKRIVLCLLLAVFASAGHAQYRCTVNGRSVIQSDPCFDENPKTGKFRCFVDGEVVYSDASCTTIKSKATLEKEAKEAESADIAKRKLEAKRLEDADRPNFGRRILYAQQATARHLRDPDSARFQSTFVSWFSGNAVVCGLVTGRNGFGGYAQPTRFVTWDNWVTLDEGTGFREFNKHWNKFCGPI